MEQIILNDNFQNKYFKKIDFYWNQQLYLILNSFEREILFPKNIVEFQENKLDKIEELIFQNNQHNLGLTYANDVIINNSFANILSHEFKYCLNKQALFVSNYYNTFISNKLQNIAFILWFTIEISKLIYAKRIYKKKHYNALNFQIYEWPNKFFINLKLLDNNNYKFLIKTFETSKIRNYNDYLRILNESIKG